MYVRVYVVWCVKLATEEHQNSCFSAFDTHARRENHGPRAAAAPLMPKGAMKPR